MTATGFEQFASEYRLLGHDPDDGAIDRLLGPRFALEVQLAPDIVRSAVRRAVQQEQPPAVLWEALHAVHRDVRALPPQERIPTPRPFVARAPKVGRAVSRPGSMAPFRPTTRIALETQSV